MNVFQRSNHRQMAAANSSMVKTTRNLARAFLKYAAIDCFTTGHSIQKQRQQPRCWPVIFIFMHFFVFNSFDDAIFFDSLTGSCPHMHCRPPVLFRPNFCFRGQYGDEIAHLHHSTDWIECWCVRWLGRCYRLKAD
jgi:hypothetical protein